MIVISNELYYELLDLSNLDNCWSSEDMQDNLEKIHELLIEIGENEN